MGSVLIAQWLAGTEAIEIRDDASVSLARSLVRERGLAVGLDQTACESMVAAISELARNQLRHAAGGTIGVRAIARGDIPGLEAIAADRGSGITDPTAAMSGAARISGSLGVGMSAAYRQVHELDIDVRWGQGTCVWTRTFVAPVPPSEIAVLSRPCRGEMVSGDHALVARDPGGATIVVADGLGHGHLAREPAELAVAEAARRLDRPADETLAACHTALTGTRGVVMTIVRLDVSGQVTHAGVGNVSTRVTGIDGKHKLLTTTAGVIGGSTRPRPARIEHAGLGTGELLIVATDGLATRADLTDDVVRLRRPPVVIAHHLVEQFGRTDDDVLVVVAR